MNTPKLSLEILNGPLDGQVITLKTETEWSKESEGPLGFPWDEELGTPQALFLVEAGEWWLQSAKTRRSTRHNMKRIEEKVSLAEGDLLQAAHS